MNKLEALILNINFTQDNERTSTISRALYNQNIGVTSTFFRNIPIYITKAIINKDINFIVLSSLPESKTKYFYEIISELNDINVNHVPVIAFRDPKAYEQSDNELLTYGINKCLSLDEAESDTIMRHIQPLMKQEEHLLQKPKKIAHIGIAVKNIEATLPFYKDSLGIQPEGIEEVKSEGVKVAFLKVGDLDIELLEPLSQSSPIQRFLEQRGEGIHHLALEVDHIQEQLHHLKTNGIRLINEEPKQGAGQSQIAFIHPQSAHGVLFELCQYTEKGK